MIIAIFGFGSAGAQTKAPSSPVEKIDTDNDGALDFDELKAGVADLFKTLETDARRMLRQTKSPAGLPGFFY